MAQMGNDKEVEQEEGKEFSLHLVEYSRIQIKSVFCILSTCSTTFFLFNFICIVYSFACGGWFNYFISLRRDIKKESIPSERKEKCISLISINLLVATDGYLGR